jgi:hypothetical protein
MSQGASTRLFRGRTPENSKMSGIEDRLDRIERKLDALLAALKTPGANARPAAGGASPPGGDIDADIDGPRGDPEVRFMPKRWTGADCKGRPFSTCEPELLDMLADTYDWFAQRDDDANAVDRNGGPKSKWSRLDAARARAWAARLRGQGDPAGGAPPRTRKAAPANTSARRPAAPEPSYGAPPGEFDESADNDDIPF